MYGTCTIQLGALAERRRVSPAELHGCNASNGHLTDSAIVANVASKNEHIGNDSTAVLTHMTFEMRSTAHPVASGINISAANETVKKIGSTNREEMVVVKPNVHTNEKEDY